MTADPTRLKFRFIFLPLVALAASFCAIYSLLNWLLVQRANLIPLNDDVATYWLPLFAGWLLVIVTVQPALGLLKKDKKGNLTFWYHAAAVTMVVVPTVIAQGYIRLATGGLTHVASLADVSSAPTGKFYSTDDVCVDLSRMGVQNVLRTSGRNNATLNFYLYAVTPLCRADGTQGSAAVWIGEEFHGSVGNRLSQDKKDAAYHEFLQSSRVTLDNRDLKSFTFFERLGRSSNRKDFVAALAHAGADRDGASSVILIPHSEGFEERTGDRLPWALGSFGIGMLVWLGITLAAELEPSKVSRWLDPEHAAKGPQGPSVLVFLVPQRHHYGLQVLLAVNVLVYVAMVLSGVGFASFDSDDLLAWGANFRPALTGLGYARLLTSQFVHSGILHLANNMYGLFFAGIFLLPITGNAGLILCYVLAGLGGSIASAYAHPATVSVGASGAIFGLFGMLIVHLLLGHEALVKARRSLLTGAAIFVALNLVLGAVSQGVDNAAHIGGLTVGIALGLISVLIERMKSAGG